MTHPRPAHETERKKWKGGEGERQGCGHLGTQNPACGLAPVGKARSGSPAATRPRSQEERNRGREMEERLYRQRARWRESGVGAGS